jgi:predicted nucleic acid-binding protein
VVFVDSNVPMYIVGAPHPNQSRAISITRELVQNGERIITDVEVYQEILHRYTAIRRPEAIDDAFEVIDALADDVLTYGMPEVRAARALLVTIPGISARDALHIAVMQAAGCSRIFSFDAGFDSCLGIERVS